VFFIGTDLLGVLTDLFGVVADVFVLGIVCSLYFSECFLESLNLVSVFISN